MLLSLAWVTYTQSKLRAGSGDGEKYISVAKGHLTKINDDDSFFTVATGRQVCNHLSQTIITGRKSFLTGQ